MYQKEKINKDTKALQEVSNDQRAGLEFVSEIEKFHEKILFKSFKIRKDVDKKLSRFFNRAYSWSPMLQQSRDRVELWTRTICTKSKVATSLTKFKRLKEYSSQYITKTQAVKMLKKPRKPVIR